MLWISFKVLALLSGTKKKTNYVEEAERFGDETHLGLQACILHIGHTAGKLS